MSGQQGTLVPGQNITVNKYSVQVEKYLSQGGFAHVYLVRTAQPVYGTTHHVLKRIAVANDAMLTEVKKEVDIMRILKGHPNIVHLIDAAWHRMANGQYEVFILMEFCAGGGIIDMMNRRLRERLTEAEILQIFVDVCEALAAMHNLRPALLHRDLKVENILQSSSTSFKLCDFGSTTPVAARPPSTTAEIRALEADLNRHTTLQYRAPEMVDPYLRRPVDEKSDVWALGVLLYKLCYYTTPFEEHGPLAILNVQYRIPPYPVYSAHMNTLIGSMLREHGAQRPSVFEVLNTTHRLRNTKSRFTYTIPVAPSVLAPRQQHTPPVRPIGGANIPTKNAGVQARDKVLEAIAPMRRGRPNSPSKDQASTEKAFQVEEDRAWNAVSTAKNISAPAPAADDAWNLGDKPPQSQGGNGGGGGSAAGFGDDFAEKLWDSFPAGGNSFTQPAPISTYKSPPPGATANASQRPPLARPSMTGTIESYRQPSRNTIQPTKSSITHSSTTQVVSGRDAFADLAISPGEKAPQTLAEARKFRTGLASMSGFLPSTSPSGFSSRTPAPQTSNATGLAPPSNVGGGPTSRPPSTRATPSPRPVSMSMSPAPSWRPPTTTSKTPQGDQSVETRFPSLEELDATFSGSPPAVETSKPAARSYTKPLVDASPPLPARKYKNETGGALGLRPSTMQQTQSFSTDGVRSHQVTGAAMRESREAARDARRAPTETDSISTSSLLSRRPTLTTTTASNAPIAKDDWPQVMRSRPTLIRKHRSSVAIKHAPSPSSSSFTEPAPPPAPEPESSTPRREPMDWLTGDDDLPVPSSTTTARAETPVLRQSPSKRASYIEKSSAIQSPQEAIRAQHVVQQAPPSPTPASSKPAYSREPSSNSTGRGHPSYPARPVQVFPSAAKVVQEPQPTLTENWSPVPSPKRSTRELSKDDSSDDDDGPEQVAEFVSRKVERKDVKDQRPKGRQSSVHDLVDMWGGNGAPPPAAAAPTAAPLQIPIRRSTIAPRAASPPSMLSAPPGSARSTPAHHRRQPSAASAVVSPTMSSASSSRNRPQSMLSFPAHNTSSNRSLADSDPASSGLQPPPDARPRSTRRTSISDMVQMYEGITKPKAAPSLTSQAAAATPHNPIPLHKPLGLKPVNTSASNVTASPIDSRFPKVQQTGNYPPSSPRMRTRPTASLPTPETPTTTSSSTGDPSKHVRASTTTGLPRSGRTLPAAGDYLDDPIRRTATPSRASPAFRAPEAESAAPSPATAALSFPARKATLAPPAPKEDTRSPSPERPYQGVGKLIDQWQRKTVEPEVRVPVPRVGARVGARGR